MDRKSYSVSEEAIREFEANGVVHIKGVVDLQLIEQLGSGIDQLVERLDRSKTGYDLSAVAEGIFEAEGGYSGTQASQHDSDVLTQEIRNSGVRRLVDEAVPTHGKRGHFRLDSTTWKRSKAVRQIALDSCLPDIAAGLLKSGQINYFDDQIFVKEPCTPDRTAFHQDYTYFHIEGWKGCVMWVCADPATYYSGAPCYVRGSHRWGAEFRANVFIAQLGFPGSRGKDLTPIEDNPGKFDIVHFDTEPGDVIVHHFRTVHGAGGNHTPLPRRAVSLRYCGDDIRFHRRAGAPSQPYHDHRLQEGDRLDCMDFPVVYPRPFQGSCSYRF